MAHYAIGDIQGCHAEFCQLLDLIGFSPRARPAVARRRPRQPRPGVARRAARGEGAGRRRRHRARQPRLPPADGRRRPRASRTASDTLAPILDAPDRDELSPGCARRPLVVVEGDLLLVHAGLLPAWTPATALHAVARGRGDARERRRRRVPRACSTATSRAHWRDDLEGFDRLRAIVNACTRLRFCTADGTMEFREKRGPRARAGRASGRGSRTSTGASAGTTVVCGHWSTLELHARAERADARLGLPVGRHADRGQARRTGGCIQVPSPRAGDAKAVRIAASAARASSRRCALARGQRAARRAARRRAGARRSHAPERRRRTIVSPT